MVAWYCMCGLTSFGAQAVGSRDSIEWLLFLYCRDISSQEPGCCNLREQRIRHIRHYHLVGLVEGLLSCSGWLVECWDLISRNGICVKWFPWGDIGVYGVFTSLRDFSLFSLQLWCSRTFRAREGWAGKAADEQEQVCARTHVIHIGFSGQQ